MRVDVFPPRCITLLNIEAFPCRNLIPFTEAFVVAAFTDKLWMKFPEMVLAVEVPS
jgi:hypothetical protein